MSTISHCYISFVRLQSHILPCSFGGTPRCFDVLKSHGCQDIRWRIAHACESRCTCKHRAPLWFREYPSSDANTIDRNIDYRSKCSSMIYDKTNVSQSSHESRSVASDGLTKCNCIQAMVSLNIYKNSANKFGRKNGFQNWKWNWRSRPINPKIYRNLNPGILHLWPKFGDPSLNRWWVIVPTSSKWGNFWLWS